MPDAIRGSMDGSNLRIGIVQARFNESVTESLRVGAQEALEGMGVSRSHQILVTVPGAVEIPLVALRLATANSVDAVITLGAIIRGGTSHFDYVCDIVTQGVREVMLKTGVPIIFGVLTCDNNEQALERSRPGPGNKGMEAAEAAIEMANLLKREELS